MQEILHQLKFRWWCSQRPGMTDSIFWVTFTELQYDGEKNYENQDFNRITKRGTCSHVTFMSMWWRVTSTHVFPTRIIPAIRTRWAACPWPQRKGTQLSERCRSVLTLPKINMFMHSISKLMGLEDDSFAFFCFGSKQKCGANSLAVSFIFGCLNPRVLKVWGFDWWPGDSRLWSTINWRCISIHAVPRFWGGVDDLAATVDSSEIRR